MVSTVGNDDLLKLYGICKLEEDGYVNLPDLNPFKSGSFKEDDYHESDEEVRVPYERIRKTGAIVRKEQRDKLMHKRHHPETRAKASRGHIDPYSIEPEEWNEEGEPYHIHPILQRNQWEIHDAADWDVIQPSVELASRIIDEPNILPFFNGLWTNRSRLDDLELERTHRQRFFRWDIQNFEIDDTETLLKVCSRLISLKKRIRWEFSNMSLSQEMFGWTAWSEDQHRCEVTLNQDYLDLLHGISLPQHYSKSWYPGTDTESALLRTRVSLAITIIHELAHCAHFVERKGPRPDPFLRDRPVNELGYELENMIFSGVIQPIGVPERPAAPYGLKINRFPGISDSWGEFMVYTRESPPEWGVHWATAYPVSMRWIEGLFTKACWDRVTRYGFKALEPPRKKGVRTRYDTTSARGAASRARSRSPRARRSRDRDRRTRRTEVRVRVSPLPDASDEEDEAPDGFVYPGRSRHPDAMETS